MEAKTLAEILKKGIEVGQITTIKREEEIRRVSRTRIKREAHDGLYITVGKLGSQWILIKPEK